LVGVGSNVLFRKELEFSSDPFAELAAIAGFEHRREGVSGSNDPFSSSRAYFAGQLHAEFRILQRD